MRPLLCEYSGMGLFEWSIYIMIWCEKCPENSKKYKDHSLLDEVVDPLDIERLRCLPTLLLLPRVIIDHEEKDIGKGVDGQHGGQVVLLRGEFDVLLVEVVHVGILLLGLDVAAVAWVGEGVQMSRKE